MQRDFRRIYFRRRGEVTDNWSNRRSARRINGPIGGRRPSAGTSSEKKTREDGAPEDRRLDPRYKAYGEATVDLRRQRRTVATGTAQIQNASISGVYLVVSFPEGTSIEPLRDDADVEVTSGPLEGALFSGRVVRIVTGSSSLGIEIRDIAPDDFDIFSRGIKALHRETRAKQRHSKKG